MSIQVTWTQNVVEQFIALGNLDDDEAYIIRTRRKKSRIQQSMDRQCSVSTIDRKIKTLKCKYDAVQAEHPDIFAPRAKDKKHLYN